jgi:hypothetical protein
MKKALFQVIVLRISYVWNSKTIDGKDEKQH